MFLTMFNMSFKALRWHTTYDVFPGGAPVPVALQPPNAVPHLVESHHQRGSSEDQRKGEEEMKGI